jgi:hypothetical protein
LSLELGTTNACNHCHTKPEENAQWAADAIKKWYGDKPHPEPHWGPAIKAGRAAAPLGEKLLLDLVARNSTPPIVRATAVDLLANYSSNASITARRDALNDSNPLVRLTGPSCFQPGERRCRSRASNSRGGRDAACAIAVIGP